MITAKSTPEEVLKELKEGYQKAKYWHVKHYGGDKKYELMRNSLLERKEDSSSDVVEYIDKNGNRWRIFESSRYYKEVGECYSSTVAFVYHETFGSCGAYVVGFHKESVEGNLVDVMDVINYTEHFFLRFCDRLKIAYKSSAMIKKFLEVCPCVTIQPREDFDGKYRKADFALPASIGRGVIKEYGGQKIYEVRTFLANIQLSSKQKRETEKLREASKYATHEPQEVRLKKALDMGISNYLDKEVERLSAIGYDNAEEMITMQTMCVLPVINLGMIGEKDYEACKRLGCLVLEEVPNAVYRVKNKDFRGSAPLEALRIIKSAGKKMKRRFGLQKCCDYIMKEMYHDEHRYSNIERHVEEYEKKIEEFDNGHLQGETDKRK